MSETPDTPDRSVTAGDPLPDLDQPAAAPEEVAPPAPPGLALPLGLFLATVFTTLWAGAYATNTDPRLGPLDFLLGDPRRLIRGLPFSATLLAILVTHELGHYVLSRVHGVPASLPLFIPGPPQFIGTFGAIIRMRGPILSRKALFDIGVAGPLAGFAVALAALVIGLRLSRVVTNDASYGLHLGEPLLLQFVAWLVVGPVPEGYDVLLHPVGFAAWFGLFVTSLNLIPIGQLDGGHVACALLGSRQRSLALAILPILLVLGYVGWPGWYLWASLGALMGIAHPPVLDPEAALGRTRIWIGWGALAIFILTFAPIPFSVH